VFAAGQEPSSETEKSTAQQDSIPEPKETQERAEEPLETPGKSIWMEQPGGDDEAPKIPRSSGSGSILGQIEDEVDLWWGSYATIGMLPSWLVAFLLTAISVSAVWIFLERGNRQVTLLGLLGAIWLVQLTRWLY